MPATSQALIKRYLGDSLQSTFFNPSQSDLLQIIHPDSGQVIWKLDFEENVVNNPASWTKGAIIGQFLGQNFQTAFSNSENLDIIQIVNVGGNIIWYLTYDGVAQVSPDSLNLMSLFNDNFTKDSVSLPLDPLKWNVDRGNQNEGPLQTIAGGPNGSVVCEYNPNLTDYALQYWAGDTPANCFVEFLIAAADMTSGINFFCFYRSKENNLGTDDGDGYGYICSVIASDDNTTVVQISLMPRNNLLKRVVLVDTLIQSGDKYLFAAINNQHACFKNGIELFTVEDSTYQQGGIGSAGIGFSNAFNGPQSGQINQVVIGSAKGVI